jgi:DNA-binding response OmpR family regulator
MRVLVIEDDGVSADQALGTEPYAALVLDLGLPRMSGLEVLRRMRSRNVRMPVLILTAMDSVEDRIKGLDTGADDYLVKPFDMGELAARLRALIRRSSGKPAPALQLAGVELDPAAHRVVYRDQAVDLSAKEFAVLHALMLNAGKVLSRAQIEEQLYAWDEEVESNAVEVYIHHLRRKLFPELIETIRGVGYLIAKDKHA